MQNIYKKKEGISIRKLGDELMLYDAAQDKVHVLNETGAMIWELMDGKNSVTQIEEIMKQKFTDIPLEIIARDTKEIIDKFKTEELIV